MHQRERVGHANDKSWVTHTFLPRPCYAFQLTMPTSSVIVRDPIYTAVKTAATERPMLRMVTIWPCTCLSSFACNPKANLSFSEPTTELTMAAYSRFCCSCLNRSRNTSRASLTLSRCVCQWLQCIQRLHLPLCHKYILSRTSGSSSGLGSMYTPLPRTSSWNHTRPVESIMRLLIWYIKSCFTRVFLAEECSQFTQ